MLTRVDDAAGNIGAVVRGALQIRQQIRPDKTGLNAAMSLLHTQDMAGAHIFLQHVDNLFQRFHFGGYGNIILCESSLRQCQNLLDRRGQRGQFSLRVFTESQVLCLQFLR